MAQPYQTGGRSGNRRFTDFAASQPLASVGPPTVS
jgi:hypothetical protein